MAANPTQKEVASFYFGKQVPNAAGQVKCKATGCTHPFIKPGNGNSNKWQHVNTHHKDYVAVMAAANLTGGSIEQFVQYSNKAVNTYKWLRFIVKNNLPLSASDDDDYDEFVEMHRMCYLTLTKYAHLLARRVKEKIAAELPEKFGLLHDGWSHGSTHYSGLFANYPDENNRAVVRLLAMSPLPDPTRQTAEHNVAHINNVLQDYNKTTAALLFTTADNTNVNPCISEAMPSTRDAFIGCYSHRLNLANKRAHEAYQQLLGKVHRIMVFLDSSCNVAGRLHRFTKLCPVHWFQVRWSTCGMMTDRYLRLHQIVTDNYQYLEIPADLLMNAAEVEQLRTLNATLQNVNDVVVDLQRVQTTMRDARELFTTLRDDFGAQEDVSTNPLSFHYARVPHRHFETGLYKLQCGQHAQLTEAEAAAMERFRKPVQQVQDPAPAAAAGGPAPAAAPQVAGARVPRENYAINARKRQRLLREGGGVESPYVDTSYVQVTSNCVERLFSSAKLVSTPIRNSMLPSTLGMIMLLKHNEDLWSVATVAEIMDEFPNV